MKYLLEKTMSLEHFSMSEAEAFINSIYTDSIEPELAAGILIGINLKGIHIDELNGFRNALLNLSLKPEIDSTNAIDLCGTGGDGKNTFNISTTTALVLASMGYRVIKHGNYGVSSLCGSSNVLEELGIHFTTNSDDLNRSFDKHNICFLHAPLFHPVMKKIAPIRNALGVRTIFNCLGPLVNPVQPEYQMTGTYSKELSAIYSHVLRDIRKDYNIVYGLDGYDELTLTDNANVFGKYNSAVFNASNFGLSRITAEDIAGGQSISDAAKIIRNILSGKGTKAHNDVISANVALAIHLFEPQTDLKINQEKALAHILSGNSINILPS